MGMASISVQDYLQTIYRLQASESPVSTTAMAAQLGIAPASVTGMIRKLHRQGLVEHIPYHGVSLTDMGEQEALRLLRRHRLWELFLTEVLGLSWDEVHQEADRLEHATSERVADRLAEFLHEPEADPHGQQIPSRTGTLPPRSCLTLSDVETGQTVSVVEVPDDDPTVLRHLDDLGLHPGTEMDVIARAPGDGPLTVRIGEAEHALGHDLVNQLLVALRNHDVTWLKKEEGNA